MVGDVLQELLNIWNVKTDGTASANDLAKHAKCCKVVYRLRAGVVGLGGLTDFALDAEHLAKQIQRIQGAVEQDPALAVGTAKELLETVCKTILAERGKPVEGAPDIPTLTKQTFRELRLVPEGIADEKKGSETVKRLLSNLASIANAMSELRNMYGTGHGKTAHAPAIKPRHAKLAVLSVAALATFLYETHKERGNP